MYHRFWLWRNYGGVCVLLLIIFLFSTDGSCPAEELGYFPGFVRFKADYDIVFFPPEICMIYFDTTGCPGCQDSLPSWRFKGNLKIDSLIRYNITEPLIQESQIAGLRINSPGLVSVLDSNNCYLLGRRVRAAVPYDTLRHDSSTPGGVVVPDISKHYYFAFDSLRNTKDIVRQLSKVSNLTNVGVIPKPIPDTYDSAEPGMDSDSVSARRHFRKQDDSSSGGR